MMNFCLLQRPSRVPDFPDIFSQYKFMKQIIIVSTLPIIWYSLWNRPTVIRKTSYMLTKCNMVMTNIPKNIVVMTGKVDLNKGISMCERCPMIGVWIG